MRRLRPVRVIAVLFAGLATFGLGLAACKQGEGQRCQRDTDCASGLVCNQATETCQATASGTDGNISPDANVDAGPIDAAVPDAAVDAAVDAALPDAAI